MGRSTAAPPLRATRLRPRCRRLATRQFHAPGPRETDRAGPRRRGERRNPPRLACKAAFCRGGSTVRASRRAWPPPPGCPPPQGLDLGVRPAKLPMKSLADELRPPGRSRSRPSGWARPAPGRAAQTPGPAACAANQFSRWCIRKRIPSRRTFHRCVSTTLKLPA